MVAGTAAAIYARVSTDEQAQNYSLPTQIEAGRRFAAQNGLDVVAEYLEDYTGTEYERPELDRLREAIRQGEIQTVIVYSVDRLGRKLLLSLMIEEELRKMGAAVRYVQADYDDTPDGVLMRQITGSMAEYERAIFMARCQRGRRGRLSAGYPLPNRSAPFGYRYVKTGPGRGVFEIVPEEAEIVKRMFEMYAYEHVGMEPLADWLTKIGAKTRYRAHDAWSYGTVRKMLTNPVYAGRYVWGSNKNRRLVELRPIDQCITVPVPAIITEELFQATQARRQEANHFSPRRTQYPYLMRGRLRCSCGHILVCSCAGMDKSHGKPRHYYVCRYCKYRLRERDIEPGMWAQIETWLRDPDEIERQALDIAQAAQGETVLIEHQLSEAEASAAAAERRMMKLIELYEDSQLDRQILEQRGHDLQAERERWRSLAAELRGILTARRAASNVTARVARIQADITGGLDNLTQAAKSQIVIALDVRGTVDRAPDGSVVIALFFA